MILLSDLLQARSSDALFAQLIQALQGVGFVEHVSGTGTGRITATGVAEVTRDIVIEIVTTGELGTGEFMYTLVDSSGGETPSGTETIPPGGEFEIPDTGVTLIFIEGPVGEGDSFVEGDRFELSITDPTFPVTSWETGGVARTLVRLMADLGADFEIALSKIAAGGLLETATGEWLTLLAFHMYGLTRSPAVAAEGIVTLSAAAGSGPYTIAAGTIWVSDAAGRRFVNFTGGTLAAGPSTLDLSFRAEQPGSFYNVGAGTVETLITSLAGVSVTNDDPMSGGVDRESDESLKLRCRARWPGLGGGATEAVVQAWAIEASDAVTRARVTTDDETPGQINVFIAGPSGSAGAPAVTEVQDFLDERIPLTSTAVVTDATEVEITITATVYVRTAQATTAQAAAEEAISDLFTDYPVGGEFRPGLSVGKTGIVSREAIVEAIFVPGVVDMSMSAPAADVELAENEVPTYALNLTWTPV